MNELPVCLTFDIDGQYYGDETRRHLVDNDFLCSVLEMLNCRNINTTWFIRIDKQIESIYGSADFLFNHYDGFHAMCRDSGHEIGWHPHLYVSREKQWGQNCDDNTCVEELLEMSPLAKAYDCSAVRMGWGYMTNRIMEALETEGYRMDSSSIPRPSYPWEQSVKDWSCCSPVPYYPSEENYQTPGEPSRKILEVPISTTAIPAPYDTEPDVMRYINPSYYSSLFCNAATQWLQKHNHLVAITHELELYHQEKCHALLSYSVDEYIANIDRLIKIAEGIDKKCKFITLSAFAKRHEMSVV